LVNLENSVDQAANLAHMTERRAKHRFLEFPRLLRRKHHQSRVQVDSLNELDEVLAIIRHEYEAALNDFCKDGVVGRASKAEARDVVRLEAQLVRNRGELGA
jgi:hypothetical protein